MCSSDLASAPYLKSLVFSAYYKLQDSDSYDNVDKEFDSIGFASDKIWIRKNNLMEIRPSYSTNSYVVKSILNRDDIKINGRYAPFEALSLKGKLAALNTLTANFTYSEGSENSYDWNGKRRLHAHMAGTSDRHVGHRKLFRGNSMDERYPDELEIP